MLRWVSTPCGLLQCLVSQLVSIKHLGENEWDALCVREIVDDLEQLFHELIYHSSLIDKVLAVDNVVTKKVIDVHNLHLFDDVGEGVYAVSDIEKEVFLLPLLSLEVHVRVAPCPSLDYCDYIVFT